MACKLIFVSVLIPSILWAIPPQYSIETCPAAVLASASPDWDTRIVDHQSTVVFKPTQSLEATRTGVLTSLLHWLNTKNVNFGGETQMEDLAHGMQAYDSRARALLGTSASQKGWNLEYELDAREGHRRFGIDLAVFEKHGMLHVQLKVSHWGDLGRPNRRRMGIPGFYLQMIRDRGEELYAWEGNPSGVPITFLHEGDEDKLNACLQNPSQLPVVFLGRNAAGGYSADLLTLSLRLHRKAKLVVEGEPGVFARLQSPVGRMLPRDGRVAIIHSNGALRILPAREGGDPLADVTQTLGLR